MEHIFNNGFATLKLWTRIEDVFSTTNIQFNREFYCIRENDYEVSCEGILYFGAQGVPKLNLDNREAQSFERLLDVLCEEFEIIDTIEPK